MKNTCRYLVLVTLLHFSLGEQIRLSFAFPFSLPLSLLLFFSLAHLRSTYLLLSTLSNGCAGPFCIHDTYHLRIKAALAKIGPFHKITRAATDTRQRVRIPM